MLVKIAKHQDHTYYTLYCPGCKETHTINDTWGFDGNEASPTFTPSILTWLDPNPKADPKYRNGKYFNGFRCHSFVENGQWRFLDDCTHELKGQTVPMVEVPNAEKE